MHSYITHGFKSSWLKIFIIFAHFMIRHFVIIEVLVAVLTGAAMNLGTEIFGISV